MLRNPFAVRSLQHPLQGQEGRGGRCVCDADDICRRAGGQILQDPGEVRRSMRYIVEQMQATGARKWICCSGCRC